MHQSGSDLSAGGQGRLDGDAVGARTKDGREGPGGDGGISPLRLQLDFPEVPGDRRKGGLTITAPWPSRTGEAIYKKKPRYS